MTSLLVTRASVISIPLTRPQMLSQNKNTRKKKVLEALKTLPKPWRIALKILFLSIASPPPPPFSLLVIWHSEWQTFPITLISDALCLVSPLEFYFVMIIYIKYCSYLYFFRKLYKDRSGKQVANVTRLRQRAPICFKPAKRFHVAFMGNKWWKARCDSKAQRTAWYWPTLIEYCIPFFFLHFIHFHPLFFFFFSFSHFIFLIFFQWFNYSFSPCSFADVLEESEQSLNQRKDVW